MNLYEIAFTYGEHEMETAIYVGKTGTTREGREYLLHVFTDDQGSGYMQDALEQPDLLVVESVMPFTWTTDKYGNPYKVTVEE